MQQQVEVEFFTPSITDIRKIPTFISSPKLGAGVSLLIAKDHGSSLLFLPEEAAFNFCDVMMKREAGTTRKLSESDQGILKEVANILVGNYLAPFSNALKQEFIEGMPSFFFGTLSAILEEITAHLPKDTLEALVAKIRFNISSLKIEGYLILFFIPQEMQALLENIK